MTHSPNRTRQTLRLPLVAGAALGALAASVAFAADGTSVTNAGTSDVSSSPSSITLTGTVRDFKWRTETNGHPDFEWTPTAGFGRYNGQVSDTLDSEHKPVFASAGYKVNSEARDAAGRNIIKSKSYIDAKSGDSAGSQASTTGGCFAAGAERFAQWYRDVPGTNVSKPVTITLNKASNSNVYTFDDKSDPLYSSRGGFFPVNGELFGNSPGQSKNFGFTFELSTEFVYKRNTGQVFTFTGDDDVWVFIDDKLVIDIGGVHGATSQTIDLDRLSWLTDNAVHRLNFFFAERHTTQSNCRIDTTLQLRTVEVPSASGLYD